MSTHSYLATTNIIMSALHSATEEMGANLLRSARSTIIREARDMSCALLDVKGRIIAEAEHVPVQMSSLMLPLESCLAKFPVSALHPNDVLITNDPFAGGQHLQDIILFSPIFHGTEVVAFAGSIAHHIDIGGGSAGLTFDAQEFYQEGLRFPAMRLRADRDFARGGVMYDLVFGNFREPETTIGDLRAQLAANHTGTQRVLALVEKYGVSTVLCSFSDALDYSERLTQAAIRQVPNGVYESEDRVDRGVFSPQPITVRLRLTVEDEALFLDFSGTDPQVPEFLNVPLGSTVSTGRSAVMMILSGMLRQIPANEGCYRPIRIEVPYGCVLNPAPPAAVRARMCAAYRVFDAILLAFHQAIPARMPALGFHVNTTAGFSRKKDGSFRIFIEDIGGGWGGSPAGDGADMLDAPLSNCKITPVEALELDHPYLRVHRYELLPDTGGAGKFRGGLGSVREYEVLVDVVQFFAYADRHRTAPRGVGGGLEGTCGAFRRVRGETVEELQDKISIPVDLGDRIQVVVGGGGGFGMPALRAKDAIERDLRLGKLTEMGATKYLDASADDS